MNYSTKLSGSLAVLILLCVGLACSESSGSETAERNSNDNQSNKEIVLTNGEFALDKAEMRVDKNGEMSAETTTNFSRSDKTIHCYINWDNPKANTKIKFAYSVVDAGGAKNQKLKEFGLTTENELQNEAYGKLKPTKPLPAGNYKVDIYINDKLARTVPFTIS